jgi:Flp pilus assembly pilin Flp
MWRGPTPAGTIGTTGMFVAPGAGTPPAFPPSFRLLRHVGREQPRLKSEIFHCLFGRATVKSPPEPDRGPSPATRFLAEDAAVTSVEYAVILTLILMVLITAVAALGSGTGGMWGGIQTSLKNIGFIQ